MAATSSGIPGLRGTDHVGFTVPNLNEAIEFFVNVIGCEPFYELGPFAAEDDWMTTHLNVHPRAVMKKLKFLRCRHGSNFELFEYSAPSRSHWAPGPDGITSAGSRVSGTHSVRRTGRNPDSHSASTRA